MTKNELLERISVNPAVCFGKPCIKGHRIWVSLILDLLAGGASVREILDDFPGLEEADILACIAYGAEMSRSAMWTSRLSSRHEDQARRESGRARRHALPRRWA